MGSVDSPVSGLVSCSHHGGTTMEKLLGARFARDVRGCGLVIGVVKKVLGKF